MLLYEKRLTLAVIFLVFLCILRLFVANAFLKGKDDDVRDSGKQD